MSTAVQLDRDELIEALRVARASLSIQMSGLLDCAIDRLEKYAELGDKIEEIANLHPKSSAREDLIAEALSHLVDNDL